MKINQDMLDAKTLQAIQIIKSSCLSPEQQAPLIEALLSDSNKRQRDAKLLAFLIEKAKAPLVNKE